MKKPLQLALGTALLAGLFLTLGILSSVYWYGAGEGSTQMALKAGPDPDGKLERAARAVLDRRCVECHSCNNAPCQLNFTSHEGILRGAYKIPAIDPERLNAAKPTRLGIDANGEAAWRKLGFFSVLEGGNPFS